MRRFTKKQMKSLLEEVKAGISNSQNPLVLGKIDAFGYTPEFFTDLSTLRQEAEALYLGTAPATGRKLGLSVQVREEIDDIHRLFMIYEQMLRRDLKDDLALFSEFGFRASRDNTISGRLMETKGFYINCRDNAKLTDYVLKYALTPEKLQAEIDRINVVENDKTVRSALVKDAEKTTEDRNKVFGRLNDRWQNYKIVLEYVFRDDKQQLEAFNLKGYTDGYKPKKKSKSPGEPVTPVGEEPVTPAGEEPTTPVEEPVIPPVEEPGITAGVEG